MGHFAVALAGKRLAPRLPLPLLFAAVQLLDILFPVFILVGLEHSRITPGITAASPLDLYDIPYSHSLVTSLGWSLLLALPLGLGRRFREAAVVAACVFSHFVLDVVTHRPDMPLAPGSDIRFGLGLWNHVAAAVPVEAAMWAAGIAIYLRCTQVRSRMGTVGFWALVVVLTAAWLSGVFGPPPPNIEVVVVSAVAFIPIVLGWAHLIDRARPPVTGAAPAATAPGSGVARGA